MSEYKKLCQIVDTLKLHFYHGDLTTQKMYNEYLAFVDNLKELKTEAQLIHNTNNDMRFVNTIIGGQHFRVMATTFRGFAVTLRNQDVSISFKSLSLKKESNENEESNNNDEEYLVLSQNPIIKIEYRASFLARLGFRSATNTGIKLIENHVVSDYKIKVSEIHLATDIQGYNFELLDYHRFKTRKRSNNAHDEDAPSNSYFYQGRKFTGFTFGQGDEMLRIYNKSVEIKKNPDKEFIKFFVWEQNPDYDENQEVWRIEIQYRRAKLKTIYDSKNGLLDSLDAVIESIPSLWDRALEKIQLVDLKHDHCIDSMLGYTIEDGVRYPIEHNTILQRIKRSVIHPLWKFLKGWLGYEANETNVYYAPKTSAFQWVGNSIKGLFSTLLKHSGELSPEILEDAFKRADTELQRDKDITLLDNAYINTMRYLGTLERAQQDYGMPINNTHDELTGERSPFNQLKFNCAQYVREISRTMFEYSFMNFDVSSNRAKILQKSLGRSYA